MLNLVPSLLVIAYPQLADLRIFLLATRDAHELYRRRSGFEVLESAERLNRLHSSALARRGCSWWPFLLLASQPGQRRTCSAVTCSRYSPGR